jgi:hypothetical protein
MQPQVVQSRDIMLLSNKSYSHIRPASSFYPIDLSKHNCDDYVSVPELSSNPNQVDLSFTCVHSMTQL